MKPPRLDSLQITSHFLEVPLGDFEGLPRALGCSLHRAPQRLTLESDTDGCGLTFEVLGTSALLSELEIGGDGAVRFLREVVGRLFRRYGGDLDATLRLRDRSEVPARLIIAGGKSEHPLLAPAGAPGAPAQPVDEERLDALLREATMAWAEYQRLRAQRLGNDPSPEA